MTWWQVNEREWDKYDIDLSKWFKPKPFGFSACFRLRNEAQFMEQAIRSHLPYVDEAVLVVQESDDSTVELAYKLEQSHPRVRVVQYPVIPHFIDHPDFSTDPINSIYSFVYLSNWALAQCKYSWIVKVEGDVICLSSFEKIVDTIMHSPHYPTLYGRVVVNLAGERGDHISATNPRNGGWDESVFPNFPNYARFVHGGKWEVVSAPIKQVCMGWSGLHMKRCKLQHLPGPWNGEQYVPYVREGVENVLMEFNRKNPYPGPDNPLGEDCIYERTWLDD